MKQRKRHAEKLLNHTYNCTCIGFTLWFTISLTNWARLIRPLLESRRVCWCLQIFVSHSRTRYERTPAIWCLCDSFCVKAAAGELSQRTCQSLLRKARVEKEEKKVKVATCPPFSLKENNTHTPVTHFNIIKHTVYTLTHKERSTLSMTCVLWYIHSCYLHFILSTSLFDHRDQISQVQKDLTGVSIATKRTLKVFKENWLFSAWKISFHTDNWESYTGLLTVWHIDICWCGQ